MASRRPASSLPSSPVSRRGPVQAGQPASQGHPATRSRAPGEQLVVALVEARRQPDPAGDAVVEVDDGLLEMRRTDLGDQAKVVRVAHEQHAGHRLHRPPGADERDIELLAAPAGHGGRVKGQPVGRRVHLHLGQVDAAPAQVLVRREAQLLVDRGQPADHDLAVRAGAPLGRLAGERLQRLERDGRLGLRVVVDVDGADVRLALVPVQPVDVVLARLVEVDGALVDERRRAEEVDLADDPRPRPAGIDDDDVVGRGRPQRDLRGREVLAGPVPPPVVRLAHVALLGEEREEVVGRRLAEPLAGFEGQLERRGAHVGQQDVEVVGVQARLLRRACEEVLRVARDVLVDGAARGDHHRDATAPGGDPPGPSAATWRRRCRGSRPAPPRRAVRCRGRAPGRWC